MFGKIIVYNQAKDWAKAAAGESGSVVGLISSGVCPAQPVQTGQLYL